MFFLINIKNIVLLRHLKDDLKIKMIIMNKNN